MTGPPPDSWAVDPSAAGAREVVPGLWRLRIPVGWEHVGHVNAYAIEAQGGAVLVDTGTGGDASCRLALDAALADAGLDMSDVTGLVLTHAHSDHVGLAAQLRDEQGVPIWAHPDDTHTYSVFAEPERFYRRRSALAARAGVPEELLPVFADVREEVEGIVGIAHPDHPLREGTRIPTALGEWEVIETPGHAPSHVCLVQRERRIAIVGDLICVAFVPWLEFGWTPDPAAELLASFDRLDAVGPLELALPGHGRALTEVEVVTAMHRAGIDERIEATRAALRDGPGTPYELAIRTFGVDRSPEIEAVGQLTETLTYLRHLQRRGEVLRERDPAGTDRFSLALAGEPAQ